MLIVITVGCVAFVMGWIISKAINAPKMYESGRLGVYHSKDGIKLVRLAQSSYVDQQYAYVELVDDSDKQSIPFFISNDKLMMFTLEGEVVNEANWNT